MYSCQRWCHPENVFWLVFGAQRCVGMQPTRLARFTWWPLEYWHISTVYKFFFRNLHDFLKARDWQCRARRRKQRAQTLAAMTPTRNSDATTDPDRNRSKWSLIQKPAADFGHNKWIGSDPNCQCLLISHFGAMIRGPAGGASYISPSARTPHCSCNLPWIMK